MSPPSATKHQLDIKQRGVTSHVTRPRIAVVVPVHNRKEKTQRFVHNFLAIRSTEWRLIIINDGSKDGTKEWLDGTSADIAVIHTDASLWWAGATNLGVRWALDRDFDYILTINDDSQFDPDFLTRLLMTAESRNRRAIVGSRLMRSDKPDQIWSMGTACHWRDNRLWHMIGQGEQWLPSVHPTAPFPVDTLCGNGTLVPCAAYRHIGLYDARNLPQYHADADWVLRAAKHGWEVLVDPQSIVFNDPGSSMTLQGLRWSIFSRKSPVYLPALLTILTRWCPPCRAIPLLIGQYAPIALPSLRRTPPPSTI